RDPEVIFTAPSQVAYITEDPLLQGIAAVRNGRVYGINASRAASTAVAEVLTEMIQLLHPE
ncbi:ABC transporter substrate-binding protein, partial [Candidatus Bipolaricaulota bacterium]|nr:ABC transporter substrate-binding protein [Candidatus Bipolaricaulota bacterium]